MQFRRADARTVNSPDVARARLESRRGQVRELRIGRRAASATGMCRTRVRKQRTVAVSVRLRRRAETIARQAAIAARRGRSRSGAQARRLQLRIVADSVRSRHHREVKCRVGEPAAAAAAIGIGRLPVRADNAATQMATVEDRHARSSICISRSCVVLRTVEADIREVMARPATVGPAERRATRGRVMAVVAPGQPLATAAVAARPAAAEVTSAEVAAVIRAAGVAVTRAAVVDIPAIAKRADSKLT